MPKQQWPLQSECDKFYGNPRGSGSHYSPAWASANLTHLVCPWALYSEKQPVPFITIHRECADSLDRVLHNIWLAVGQKQAEIDKLHYSIYDGSFNYRPMRGSSHLSMHAYGCALDWDAAENPFHSKHHLFDSKSLIVVKFREEGWIWGGEWTNPDAMHFQAARIK